MLEVVDTLLRPILSSVLAVARAVLWLGWDFGFQIVGWSIGWVVCRIITFGKFPHVGFGEVEEMDFWVALLVEIIGLLVLALAVFLLAGYAA